MPTKQECEQIQSEFEALKSLREEFVHELDEAVKSGKVGKAEKLKQEIETRLASLEERVNPLERIFHVREQYERQRGMLEKTGILERLSSGEMGVRGIDGREYPLPTLQEIHSKFKEKRELLKTKAEQGFTKVLIVPQGMSLHTLINKYKEVILRHHSEDKLLAAKIDPQEPDTPLYLDTNQPVYAEGEYQNADVSGELVYYPKKFSQNHEGKTKGELIKEEGAWDIMVIEENPIIPGKNEPDEIKGGRKRIKVNKSPRQYLADLQTAPQYQGESGLTPEGWLILAMTHLEETNQVLDDWQGTGKANYNLGACFKSSGRVPFASWDRVARQALLDRDFPAHLYSGFGARSAVRVQSLKT